MAIVRTLDSKFYSIDDTLLEGKEVDPTTLPYLPKSLPAPPEAEDVQGHDHCHHWYNWHNHHWHNHHHHHHDH